MVRAGRVKGSLLFFICAFTLGFFVFSMGNSALNSQKRRLEKYTGENNRGVIISCNYDMKSKDLQDILKDNKVSIQLVGDIRDEESQIILTTSIKGEGLNRLADLREGKYLSKEDYTGEKLMGLFSSSLCDEGKYKVTLANGETLEVYQRGKTFDTIKSLDVPNELFFTIKGSEIINRNGLDIVISGDKEEVASAIDKLKTFIKTLDGNGTVTDYFYVDNDISKSASQMMRSSYIIIFITIINSIAIAFLWVIDNKKEIILRKVCGARNFNLAAIFFGKLFLVGIISVMLAIGLQYAIGTIFKGVFLNLDIRLTMKTIQNSLILSIGVTFMSSIPAFLYISDLQPAEMLREE